MEVLKARNVSKVYHQGSTSLQALKQINLTVRKGEFVAILGRSGSGKSTLLNILAGLDHPDEGEVFINDVNLNQLDEEKRTRLRRETIGFVFQTYDLLPSLTVIDNIRLPELKDDDAYVRELMDRLEIRGYEKFYPDQLSGGQQQRVSMARALINKPSILFADEPTGNLDSKTEKIVIEILKDLIKNYGTSIILVTHNENLISDVDRVIGIEDGEIVNG